MAKKTNNPLEQEVSGDTQYIEQDKIAAKSAHKKGEKPAPTLDVLDKNKKLIIAGVLGALVLVGFFIGYRQYKIGQGEEAVSEMAYAFEQYEKDSLKTAVAGDGQNPGLETIASDYSGTDAANQAQLLLANAAIREGNLEKAKEHLSAFQQNGTMVSASALSLMAYVAEEEGDFEAAAKHYLGASRIKENGSTTPDLLMQAGRCYEEAGKSEEALKLYQRIKNQYPLSEAGRVIDRNIAAIEAAPKK